MACPGNTTSWQSRRALRSESGGFDGDYRTETEPLGSRLWDQREVTLEACGVSANDLVAGQLNWLFHHVGHCAPDSLQIFEDRYRDERATS